jgi:hypothetical protein
MSFGLLLSKSHLGSAVLMNDAAKRLALDLQRTWLEVFHREFVSSRQWVNGLRSGMDCISIDDDPIRHLEQPHHLL